MTDTEVSARRLAETGHTILTMGVASFDTYLRLSGKEERVEFLRSLVEANEIFFMVFWLSEYEYSFLPIKGDSVIAAAGTATAKAGALFVPSFEAAVSLGMYYGDEDARQYLPTLTPSRIPPKCRFRPFNEEFLTAAEERRQRRADQRAREAARG
ncbi:hypothetical protein [Methylorubrum populi]|uniref:hypothetical protein n=1 Tax=Methylorubrum populi TaxID=223967 RepID=UPI003F656F8F